MRFSNLFVGALLSAAATAEVVPRSTFTEVTNYGDNPSDTLMYLYVPSTLAVSPPVVVGIHWCHGTATAYYQGTQWANLAEQYGFIVIYPESPYINIDGCWDVSSDAALTHGGGGDSNSIANMVDFVLQEYNANAERVYVTGISSGAMMTNVMAAVYPELFEAGIAYAGVPAGCFMSADDIEDYWNATCALGNSVASQSYWVNGVRDMHPGYSGPYPRLQIYHGDSDEVLNFNNYGEAIKLWTGIFGYDYRNPAQVLQNDPASSYTKYVFGPKLQGIVGAGVPHNIAHNEREDAEFFGLLEVPTETSAAPPTTAAPTTTTRPTGGPNTSTTAATTTTASGATQSHWGQCAGIGYTGPTQCESPYTCTYLNDWYSQCL